jgi:amino acid adenylation domain-containing protein
VQVLGDDTTGGDFTLAGIESRQLELGTARAMFDLVINFWEGAHSLRVDIGYTVDIFDEWRMRALCEHIATVLRAAVENPQLRLSEIPMLPETERERVLAAGRGELVELSNEPVHVFVAEAAARYPDHIAAVCRGRELTYRELDRRAGALARHLRQLGVEHEQIVAIAMDRDLDALVAMLGVLKAGAAFTVLDPSHPAKRLDYMLRDTATPLVITRSRHVERLPAAAGWHTVLLDTEWPAIEAAGSGPDAGEPLPEWASGSSLAYVLYTSGSTGQPKGVLIDHRALLCFLEAYKLTFDFTPESRLLQLPALTFDMSMGEIFLALVIGATLVQVSPEEGQSPDALSALMREQRVNYASLPPAILSVLEPEPYPDLVWIMSGADAVPAEMVNKWNLPGRRFVDLYGPTEAAIACTEYVCEGTDWRTPPPIGHPELNRIMYVVDRWGNLAPVGVPGELLIGGDEGLARGYLNQPELTAEKFIADPFRTRGRVYRSGDLVRWRPDLELDFLGRIDHQVKLRGLRIELGEIEAALLAHPQVRMAVVLLRPDQRGEKRLIGYYTAASDPAPSIAELRRHLGEELPEYMVPTAWVHLEEFPLTAARKIERSALPEPGDGGADEEDTYVAPQTPTETRVTEIIGEVLSLPRVGAVDNFFDLGGNSLQAMRVVSRINKAFGVKVNIRTLYGTSTVSAISSKIDGMVAAKAGR